MRISKTHFAVAMLSVVLPGTWLGWRYAFAVALSADQVQKAQPYVEIPKTVWDFGTVSNADYLEASFPVRNVGNGRLLLIEHSRSCGCLSAGKPEVTIPPGGKTRLKRVLDARRLRGAVRKHVQYRTNDPDRPTLTLTLAAVIQLKENGK